MIPNSYTMFLTLLTRIPAIRSKKAYHTSSVKQRLDSDLTLYNGRQAFDQFFPELHIRIDQEDYMAKQNSNFNLIEYRLTDEQIESFEAWLEREKLTVVQALNYCAEKRIKVSCTFSEKQESWCVSLTGQEENRFNAATTLTTWSDDALEAIFMAVYKASVVFGDGKWQTRKSSSRG